MRYRREIDGLRAVAVLPVILFHAGFKVFEGGFIGVDVFFVISGYLITTIILSDMNKGEFSIVTFYERRASRILPALFFVMLCCLPFAWFWLSPSHFKDFSQSLTAVSLFSSNILFWRESSYFATAAELKPLLHTWSLSVEEQYYVLFPLFLMALWKLRKRWIFGSLILVAVLSLMMSQWGAYNSPSATFFLLPTRGWELAMGALIAFYFLYKKERSEFITSHKAVSEFLGLLGLTLICYPVFAFNKSTPFPSIYALMPTTGTVLIIVFSTSNTIVGRFLSTKVMVGIGLVSYSTYLWHQPLFVFARHLCLTEPSVTLLLTLSILSIVLAYFSWHYIEMPFRNKTSFGRKNIFTIAVFCSFGLIITGIFGSHIGNYAVFSDNELAIIEAGEQSSITMKTSAYDRHGCFFDYSQSPQVLLDNSCVKESVNRRVILFGDSEAAHYLEGFAASSERFNFDLFQWTGTSCRVFDYPGNSKRCKDFLSLFYENILNTLSANDVLIVSSNWLDSYQYMGNEQFEVVLRKSLKKLMTTKANIIVFGGTPDFTQNPYDELIKLVRRKYENNPQYLKSYDYSHSDEIIKNVVKDLSLKFFSPASSLCVYDFFLKCLFREEGNFTFFDSGHLSFYGSTRIVNQFFAEFYSLFD